MDGGEDMDGDAKKDMSRQPPSEESTVKNSREDP